MSDYTEDSALYLGTTDEPECAGAGLRRQREVAVARGITVTPSERPHCRGTVIWVWTHSGWGTDAQPLCEACLAWVARDEAPYHLSGEHALVRDGRGAWVLREDARLV